MSCALVGVMVTLEGCGWVPDLGGEPSPPDTEFIGAVVADEPLAVQVARDVLVAGGNAADAATALYFTLAVTLPSMATLGGGGVCVVHDRESQSTQTVSFYPEAPDPAWRRASRPSSVPANMRGFVMLHDRFGLVKWGDLLQPAERLARQGFGFSQAFARHLKLAANFVLADAEARSLFLRRDGQPVQAGDTKPQLDLASVLAQVRVRGAGAFYNGSLGKRFMEAVQEAGGSLTAEALRKTKGRWAPAASLPIGTKVLHTAPPPAGAGLTAAQMTKMLVDLRNFQEVPSSEKPHLFIEAAIRAMVGRRQWAAASGVEQRMGYMSVDRVSSDAFLRSLFNGYDRMKRTRPQELLPNLQAEMENPAGTGFAVIDMNGNAVACTVSPNNPFGIGRIATGSGIFIGADPDVTRGGPISHGPMLMLDSQTQRVIGAFAGAGGVAVPTALARMLVALEAEALPIDEAIRLPRLHHSGFPDMVYHEGDHPKSELNSLTSMGYEVKVYPQADAKSPSRINAIFCPGGVEEGYGNCQAVSDPRGSGLGISVKENE